MGAFTIRPAQAADQATIKRLVNEAHLNPMDLRWQNFLLAVVQAQGGEQVIGCIQARPHRPMAELSSLVVAVPYRKMGIGSALIQALLQQHPGALFLMCQCRLTSYYRLFGFHLAGPEGLPLSYSLFYRIFNRLQPGQLCAMRRE